jgi:hypothetical protein
MFSSDKFIKTSGKFSGILILLVLPLCVLFFSCQDENIVPGVPILSFESYDLVRTDSGDRDSLLIITLNYEDSDGDLGLTDADTTAPYDTGRYRFNLWVDIVDMSTGTPEPIYIVGTTRLRNFDKRLPDLTPTGKDKFIRGNFKVTYTVNQLAIYPDVIRVEAQLLDRALNKSEVVRIDRIELDQQ